MRARCLLFVAIFLMAACDQAREQSASAPIVVYAPGGEGADIAGVITEFTAATGIQASIRWGTSSDLTDAVIQKTGVPADVLLTDNVADIWRAADEGALRPVNAEGLQDPDGYWMAFSARQHYIVAGEGLAPQSSLDDLTTAADGRVCVVSAAQPDTRSLIALLIDADGLRETGRLLRHLRPKLYVPLLASNKAVLAAVQDGRCDYGIVTAGEVPLDMAAHPLLPITYNASAVGVGRHARNAEAAQQFVEWMTETQRQAFDDWPHPGIIGYRDEEARELAERVGWR